MRIEDDIKLDYSDVLIRPKRSTLPSRSVVTLQRQLQMKHTPYVWEGVPLVAANMDTIGTREMAEALAKKDCVTALHKFYRINELVDIYDSAFNDLYSVNLQNVFFTFGVSENDRNRLKKFRQLLENRFGSDFDSYPVNSPMICLDVANGYFEAFSHEHVPCVRELFPNSPIMAGNVVTGEMTEQLILSGADIVKVGIGPGSVCTTRKMTGVGYPQLSAVIECADAAHGMNGWVCADGGCVTPGDVAKAYGAGADFVMLGGMLAGTDECGGDLIYEEAVPGPVIEVDGADVTDMLDPLRFPVGMKFYGMSSETAMEEHYGGVSEYRASEGKTVIVDYKGPVENTLLEILGGVRSMMTYIGAATLKHVPKATTFVRVNNQLNTSMNGKEV